MSILNTDLVIYFEKMAVKLFSQRYCMKLGQGTNSGILGFRN